MIDGRPIVVLYTADFVAAYDQGTFDYVSQQFQSDFGTTPYLIRHSSWSGIKTDVVYAGWPAWYSATVMGDAATVMPGVNNFAIAGALGESRIVDRNCGDLYQSHWNEVLSRGARLVLIQTWNELHEATGISATKEYGRRYIDLTAQNVARWKSPETPTAPPPRTVWASLGPLNYQAGVYPAINHGDGKWLTTRMAGHDAIYSPTHYIYLGVDERILPARPAPVWVTVEYLDRGSTPWRLQYDGATNAYTSTALVTPQNTRLWRRQTFYLPDAVFQKREAGSADLRIDDHNTQGVVHYFNRVWITRSPPSGEPPQMPLLSDLSVQEGKSADVPGYALDSSGMPLPLALASGPGFVSLQGGAGAQALHVAPSLSDARSCSDVTGPGVTSSPAYTVAAVANEPGGSLPGASTFRVTVTPAPVLSWSAQSLSFTTASGQDPPAQSLTVSNTGPAGTVLDWTATASTRSGGGWLSVSPAAGTNEASVQVTAHAASLAVGSYSGSITITSPGAENSPATVDVTLNVAPLSAIQAIYDPWNYQLGVSPGAWVTIGGAALAPGPAQTWNLNGTRQLPTALGGVTVLFNGLPAALSYVSPTQINALVPAGVAPGPVQVVIQSNGVSSTPFATTATATLPAIYALPNAGGSAFFVTAALAGTATLVGNSAVDARVVRAAQPGDVLDLYMVGLGRTVDPSRFVTDQVFSGAYPVEAAVSATVGGQQAAVLFAGLTAPGLYLVRIAIPSDLPAGPSPIQISAGASQTRPSLILMLSAPP
jgi:uncharacterized protein (TIGR03437 family)